LVLISAACGEGLAKKVRQFSDSQALKNLKSLLLKEGDRKESLVISCAATDESRSDRRETSTRQIVETGDHCPGFVELPKTFLLRIHWRDFRSDHSYQR
jgi:hypothetical protein